MNKLIKLVAIMGAVATLAACDRINSLADVRPGIDSAVTESQTAQVFIDGAYEISSLVMTRPNGTEVNMEDQLDANHVVNVTARDGNLTGRIASSGKILYQASLISSKSLVFNGQDCVVETYTSTVPEDIKSGTVENVIVVNNKATGVVGISVFRKSPDGAKLETDLTPLDPAKTL